MHRFFVDAAAPDVITGEEFTHLSRVLRLKPGDAIEVLDGNARYLARIDSIDKQKACLTLGETLPKNEPQAQVTLYQALVRTAKMEIIVQKATELGAARIVPLQMRYCNAKLEGGNALSRLERIAREAVKQCGRSVVPKVEAPIGFEECVKLFAGHEALLMPYEKGGSSFSTLAARDIGIIIGPEGGFAPEEVQLAQEAGAMPLTLGSRILRAETAAIAALTLSMYMLGEMGAKA